MYHHRPFQRRYAAGFESADAPFVRRKKRRSLPLLLFLFALLLFMTCAAAYLRSVSTDIAVSDASDVVTARIHGAIAEIMRDGDYDGDYFVTFEKGSGGEVTAVSCNMARINALSAQILDCVVDATENYTATVRIPLGNLTGISLLMGHGPKIPVDIITLTSSRVEFSNNIVTAGINQTKHQIELEVIVDIDVLVPWGSESTQVKVEVLIADTVVVGQVPETYLTTGGQTAQNGG